MTAILRTRRLTLRELTFGDTGFVHSLLGDLDVMRYFGRIYDEAGAAAWIERQQSRYARDGFGYWLAELAATGAPVGQVGLMLVDDPAVPDPSLGYIIDKRHWRRGLATEAAIACRHHALETLEVPRVVTLVRPENEPSLVVAHRAGFTACGEMAFAGYRHIVLEARPTTHAP